VRHNTVGGRQDNLAELTTGQEVDNPLFNFVDRNIESGGDDTALVEAAIEFNDNFLRTVVVDDFEFTNISCGVVILGYQKGGTGLVRKMSQMSRRSFTSIFRCRECMSSARLFPHEGARAFLLGSSDRIGSLQAHHTRVDSAKPINV